MAKTPIECSPGTLIKHLVGTTPSRHSQGNSKRATPSSDQKCQIAFWHTANSPTRSLRDGHMDGTPSIETTALNIPNSGSPDSHLPWRQDKAPAYRSVKCRSQESLPTYPSTNRSNHAHRVDRACQSTPERLGDVCSFHRHTEKISSPKKSKKRRNISTYSMFGSAKGSFTSTVALRIYRRTVPRPNRGKGLLMVRDMSVSSTSCELMRKERRRRIAFSSRNRDSLRLV